jgi:tight adherence protein C
MQMVYLGVLFVAVFGVSIVLLRVLLANPVKERMQGMASAMSGGIPLPADTRGWSASIARLAGPFARLSIPEDGWESSPVRTRFVNAGLHKQNAAAIYFAAKTLLAFALPVAALLLLFATGVTFTTNSLLMLSLLMAAALGFYAPNIVLASMIRTRQREIVERFPDALDLMMVCVEAGLGIDAAIARIASEMSASSPILAGELHLVTLDLRAGSSKERALRNLGIRTGVEEVDSLAATLIQAERFGTSIGDALRVHSDTLRTRRRQRAEEAAAKIGIKLLFPLIFCIFPAIMLVLLGPALMQLFALLGRGGH